MDRTATMSLNDRSRIEARGRRRSAIALAAGVAGGCYVIAGLAVLYGMQFTSLLDLLIASAAGAAGKHPSEPPPSLTTLLATVAIWTCAVGVVITGGLQAVVMPHVGERWTAVSVGIFTGAGGILCGAGVATLVLG